MDICSSVKRGTRDHTNSNVHKTRQKKLINLPGSWRSSSCRLWLSISDSLLMAAFQTCSPHLVWSAPSYLTSLWNVVEHFQEWDEQGCSFPSRGRKATCWDETGYAASKVLPNILPHYLMHCTPRKRETTILNQGRSIMLPFCTGLLGQFCNRLQIWRRCPCTSSQTTSCRCFTWHTSNIFLVRLLSLMNVAA